jgi:ectoine hydroxylase-related dioxygenase (phytanoyl-CoA dioxygenase family)
LTEAERYRFEADGYLVVASALPRADVQAIRDELADPGSEAADYGYGHQEGDLLLAGGSLRSVTHPLASTRVVLDAALHPGFFPKVYDLFGGAVRLLSDEYFVTPSGARPRLGWHRDVTEENFPGIDVGASLLLVNCLLLLSDVGPDGGPTLAIPGSHRWGRGTPLPGGALGNPDPESVPGYVRLQGEAGTSVFFNGRLFHAQSANRAETERRALVFVYGHRWMRAFPGFEPTPDVLAELGGTPMRDQLLGAGPAFDEPAAEYESPARWLAASGVV